MQQAAKERRAAYERSLQCLASDGQRSGKIDIGPSSDPIDALEFSAIALAWRETRDAPRAISDAVMASLATRRRARSTTSVFRWMSLKSTRGVYRSLATAFNGVRARTKLRLGLLGSHVSFPGLEQRLRILLAPFCQAFRNISTSRRISSSAPDCRATDEAGPDCAL